MHIEQLRLNAFGPFTEQAIELQPGLNVLYGPNEAGKSSMLRAVHALLFGVPSRTTDNFVHGYPNLRIGGVLLKADGERLKCVRRKGNKATLRDGSDDKQLAEGTLDRFLGAIDEEFFRLVFGIDHQRLREGGEEVIQGKGRIGELLFAAGGVSHLRDIQKQIEEEAAQLFKPRAQQPQINKTVSRLGQLRGEIRDSQASSDQWTQHEMERKRNEQLAERARKEISDAEAAKARLHRFKTAWPTLSSWKTRQAELNTLNEVVLLPEDAEKQRTDAHQQLSVAESDLRRAKQQIQTLANQIQLLQVPTDLLQEQVKVDELYKRLGSHEKDVKDRATLDARRRAAKNNVRQSIDKLGWSLSIDEVGEQRLPDEQKVAIRTLAKRHGGLAERVQSADKSSLRTKKRLQEFQSQLEESPAVGEEQKLANALADALAATETAEQLSERTEHVNRIQHDAEDALARLPLWNGSLEDLRRLKVPSESTIEEFDQLRRDITSKLEGLNQRLSESRLLEEQLLKKLAKLEGGDVVPTEDELGDVRNVRDLGVRLAAATLEGQQVEPSELNDFVDQIPDGSDLASALALSVRQADAIVDRLRREADRVAEKAQLLAQTETLRKRSTGTEADISSAEDEQRQYEQDWASRWQETGLCPSSPPEMRSWLRQHAELLELTSELNLESESLSNDKLRCESLQGALANELSQSDAELDLATKTFKEVVKVGQEYCTAAEQLRARRRQLESDIERTQQELTDASEELQVAEIALSDWTTAWSEAMKPLQLPADAMPEQAEAVLANLEQLFKELDEAEGYRNRIWGIDKTTEEFTQAAIDLASHVAKDLVEMPVEEIAGTLNNRVSEARRIDEQSKTLCSQLEELQEVSQQAEVSEAESLAVLEGLLRDAGCKTTEELSLATERSDQKRQLQTQLEELKSQLAPHCGGMTLEDFQTDAESEDVDRLESQITELDEQMVRLREERENALTATEREANELKMYDGCDTAAEKALERQCLISCLEEDVQEYAVTCAASGLLKRAIENYQQHSQGPVLSRASDCFKKLTCGAFDSLRADYDESGNDILVGVRPDGKSTLRVEGMSEGSRDQLYLALRLATLEHWLDNHEPVPYIVDDILMSFDDRRSEAALETLLELSSRTQVLFFTHHKHLVSLAEKVGISCSANDSVSVLNEWCK